MQIKRIMSNLEVKIYSNNYRVDADMLKAKSKALHGVRSDRKFSIRK